jgi:hypothetical protein
MDKANRHYISSILSGLQLAEAKGGRPLDIDPNDEASAKRAFRQYVAPHVERLEERSKELLKTSFAFFLKKDGVTHWDRTLADLEDLSLREPRDLRRFFLWLWEVLYPDTRFQDVPTEGIVEDNDVMRVNEFYGLDSRWCISPD